jgi:hypothetical protein
MSDVIENTPQADFDFQVYSLRLQVEMRNCRTDSRFRFVQVNKTLSA